jgi:hypothetical protein
VCLFNYPLSNQVGYELFEYPQFSLSVFKSASNYYMLQFESKHDNNNINSDSIGLHLDGLVDAVGMTGGP